MNYKIAWSNPVVKGNLYLEFENFDMWIYCTDLGVIAKSSINQQYLFLVNKDPNSISTQIYKYCLDNYEKILQDVKNFLVKEML